MRIFVITLACLLALSMGVWHSSAVSAAVDLTGKWELKGAFPDAGVVDMDQGEMTLKQTGTSFTGTIHGRPIKGSLNGSNVSLTISYEGIPHDIDVVFSGRLIDQNTMKGAVTFIQYGKGTWTATRNQ
jgi:hypothetical protein